MFLLSPSFLVPALAVSAVLYVWARLRSPIARLPGPPLSLYGPWALRWHELQAGRTRYVDGLHRRYGPAVRLGPGEAAFASASAIREIYCSGGGGYDKTEFYDLFQPYGRRYVLISIWVFLILLYLWAVSGLAWSINTW